MFFSLSLNPILHRGVFFLFFGFWCYEKSDPRFQHPAFCPGRFSSLVLKCPPHKLKRRQDTAKPRNVKVTGMRFGHFFSHPLPDPSIKVPPNPRIAGPRPTSLLLYLIIVFSPAASMRILCPPHTNEPPPPPLACSEPALED